MSANMCSFPGCTSIKGKGAYCIKHGRIYGSTVFDTKPVKPIAKRSESMAEKMKEYKPLAAMFLKKHPQCQLRLSGCTKVATCVHHTRGREGKQLTNQADWMASCTNCNRVCEEKDAEARAKGIKKSKHAKQ